MKSFIQLLLLAGAAFFAYDYWFDGKPGLFNSFEKTKILEANDNPIVKSRKKSPGGVVNTLSDR